MNAAHWHLSYAGDLASEPVLWELSHKFGLRTNIRRANIEADIGWAIVEVHGDEATLAAAQTWLTGRGVTVETLPG